MPDAFRDVLSSRLSARGAETLITFLHRKGGMQAASVSADMMLRAAQAQAKIWRDTFGQGRFVLALALPHGMEFVTAVLAGLLEGIVVVALPPGKTGDPRLPHIVKDCGARAVIALPEGLASLSRALKDEGKLPCPVYAPDGALLAASDAVPCDASVHPSTVLVQYTSGSTRLPKGVEMSGANILANADLVARTWGLGRDTVVINWMPHYHDMGLMGCLLYPVLFGGASVQLSPFDVIRNPLTWLQAIQDHNGTITGGPAFIYAECLKRLPDAACEGLDLSSLKQMFCGAEPVPADLLPAFQARFERYGLARGASFACYGMAENALFIAGAQPSSPTSHSQTIAPCRLTPETRGQLRIVAADGSECSDGAEGEIRVSGPGCTRGYLNLPEETARSFIVHENQTWLRTGDLGLIQGQDLFITGRVRDMLIVHGRNVAATEVEWLAAAQDKALNRHAAAVFAPDPATLSEAVLLIEVTEKAHSFEQADILRTTIERAVRGALGVHLTEVRFLPRGTLPKTSSGKVRRAAAASSYADGTLHPGLQATQKTETA